jgi:hypothetical protein
MSQQLTHCPGPRVSVQATSTTRCRLSALPNPLVPSYCRRGPQHRQRNYEFQPCHVEDERPEPVGYDWYTDSSSYRKRHER